MAVDVDVELAARLARLSVRDGRRLQRMLEKSARQRDTIKQQAMYDELTAAVEIAELALAQRRAAVPEIRYPAELPISQRKADIAAAISASQVVVVAGETGSGKTTQLPKICLELGRGVRGLIGHTQPRRLAARTVADRIAEELGSPLGEIVGYTVRFTDHVSENTLVRLMTDGILLAEIQRDRELVRYDTLIIDEAHERSLNIDFLLGYLKQLLPRRPDLKVIITSATIDPGLFSRHFDDAPVVEVSGRTYPVEVRYRPLVVDAEDDAADDVGENSGEPRDQTQAIVEAVDELLVAGDGDALVFLSGEREIRDTADALRAHATRVRASYDVLPLYARLSAAEQHEVFAPHDRRRIVLATNVAETSLTVPGIRYVIDPGTARISRYSTRLKVQRLPIEAISQASANQRKGRCGRTSAGICIRLYAEEDFLARPEFTDPEILRTNLASVILQMTALGLGDIAAFPFVEPPDRRNVKDGVQLLEELAALHPGERDPRKSLTSIGRELAQLPIDPRLARMVVEGQRNGCAYEAIVIAAALSIQDPRERPAEKQQAADELHRRFADETSDFLAYLNLWNYVHQQQKTLSSSAFRRLCKREFLHYLRIREWQDLVSQLRSITKIRGVPSAAADPRVLHTSLLAGLLSHIGLWDNEKRQYVGARGARFSLWPGSALSKKPPTWVIAGELVETTRLWGRDVARIDPEWAEPLAAHLVKHTYSEPHWSAKRGAAMAYERVTLYGVPLVSARRVNYGRIDPATARELFIRHALVQGEWRTHHRFYIENRELLEELEGLEHRTRRRDIVVDEEAVFDFYDKRIPADITSVRDFDVWWKNIRCKQPDLLQLTTEILLAEHAADIAHDDYPHTWTEDDLTLPMTYRFEPGSDADGVTIHIPLAAFNRFSGRGLDWQVPGLRLQLVTALIKSLPKTLRRSFVPVPGTAASALGQLTATDLQQPVLDVLGRELRRVSGVDVPRDAWDMSRVPDHLRVTYAVEDERGAVLAQGKDLDALRRQLAPAVTRTVARVAQGLERSGLRDWTFEALPQIFEDRQDDVAVKGFPALVEEPGGASVGVRVLASHAEQQREMWIGTRRLLLLTLPSPLRAVVARLDLRTKLALAHNPHGGVPALLDDCVAAAVDALMHEHAAPAWTEESFRRLQAELRPQLPERAFDVVAGVAGILLAAHDLHERIVAVDNASLAASVADMREQLAGLLFPGFVVAVGAQRLPDVLRYLEATGRRLDVLRERSTRDRQLVEEVRAVHAAYTQARQELPVTRRDDPDVENIRWMIEELRISLFAQQMRTAYPISAKRIFRAIAALTP